MNTHDFIQVVFNQPEKIIQNGEEIQFCVNGNELSATKVEIEGFENSLMYFYGNNVFLYVYFEQEGKRYVYQGNYLIEMKRLTQKLYEKKNRKNKVAHALQTSA
jgi:hypothetical protein